jgi:hypothetical protein
MTGLSGSPVIRPTVTAIAVPSALTGAVAKESPRPSAL